MHFKDTDSLQETLQIHDVNRVNEMDLIAARLSRLREIALLPGIVNDLVHGSSG